MISLDFNSYKIDQIAIMDGNKLLCLVSANLKLRLSYPGNHHPAEQANLIGSPDFISIDINSIPDLITELRMAQFDRPK